MSAFPTERAKPWTQAGLRRGALGALRCPWRLRLRRIFFRSSRRVRGPGPPNLRGKQACPEPVARPSGSRGGPGRQPRSHLPARRLLHTSFEECAAGSRYSQARCCHGWPVLAHRPLSQQTGCVPRPRPCASRPPCPRGHCPGAPPPSCRRRATPPSTVQHPAGSTLRTQPVPPPGRSSGPVAPPRKAPQGFRHPDTRWACLFTRVCNGGLARALHAGLPGRTKKRPQ